MEAYPFHLVRPERRKPLEDREILRKRPFSKLDQSFQADARRFVPGDALATAINTAIALGEPLLITGEPGTGKTQAAYYAAWQLDLEPTIHFQVKSESTAKDLLYDFDMVRYFHDAHLANVEGDKGDCRPLDKRDYVEPRALWKAFEQAKEENLPRVLLIDEIDKAPRDFPNDLLHELDKMEFVVTETGQPPVSAPRELRPVVFITSNSERRLPEPFLRRCVYHHIRFDDDIVRRAVEVRRKDEFSNLTDSFLEMAMDRFLQIRDRCRRKPPATGEYIMWLRALSLAAGTYPDKFEKELARLPYLGVLVKDHQDMEELGRSGRF